MGRAKTYSNMGKKCNLCILERHFIICKTETCSLNKRNELASACRHANRFLIKKVELMTLRMIGKKVIVLV